MLEKLPFEASDGSEASVPLRRPPFEFADRERRRVRIARYDDDRYADLQRMYETFDRTQRAQGVPPRTPAGVSDWLDDVLGGVSVVAVHDDSVVGHVMFLPDGEGAHEAAIFVHQDYQRAGIGTRLLGAGLAHARAKGVSDVWLSVERSNRGAQKLYRRAGFRADVPTGTSIRMSRRL